MREPFAITLAMTDDAAEVSISYLAIISLMSYLKEVNLPRLSMTVLSRSRGIGTLGSLYLRPLYLLLTTNLTSPNGYPYSSPILKISLDTSPILKYDDISSDGRNHVF